MSENDYNRDQIRSGALTPEDIGHLVVYGLDTGSFDVEDLVPAITAFQLVNGLVSDGKAGPATVARIRVPGQADPPRPRTRRELYRTFGNPGRPDPNPEWTKANIVTCHPRGDRASLPGVPEKWWVPVNRALEPLFRRALARALDACPEYRIERFGCRVYRHERHDRTRALSLHSWGVAFDVDPQQNRAVQFTKNKPRPEPWSSAWLEIWPSGLPREWVVAIESAGLVWGGRWTGYCDPMHFQYYGYDSQS